MRDETPELTVYYDGGCPLCRAEIAHYRGQAGAGAIRFVDAARPGAGLGPGLDRRRALARLHARTAEGELVSGAAAFARIWALLPRWRPAARVAALPGVIVAVEVGYRMFLPLRPYMARLSGWLGAQRVCGR